MDNNEQKILQKHLARFILDEVFNLPEEKDLLEIKTPLIWNYKGRQLGEAEIIQLRGQAEKFIDGELWRIIKNALNQDAINRGVLKSQTEADIITSKVELYLIKTIEDLLKHMIQKP